MEERRQDLKVFVYVLFFLFTASHTPFSNEYLQSDVAVAIRKSIAERRPILQQECILLQNITNSGLEVRSVEIPPDGNCLFHAISDQLTRVKDTPCTHSELRALAVEALKNPSTIGVGWWMRKQSYLS